MHPYKFDPLVYKQSHVTLYTEVNVSIADDKPSIAKRRVPASTESGKHYH